MGSIKNHPPVRLVIGLTYAPDINPEQIYEILEQKYSSIEERSQSYEFSSFTPYYAREMGDDLAKLFLVFARLIDPILLPDIKNTTNLLEKEFSRDEKRQVNLDPGYISEAKLVLATTKNYAHRIYLDKGIFGDIHLAYTNQSFQKQPWTYPDYQQKEIIDFFNNVREKYLHQIGEQKF
jgi:hypothetical protein